VPIFLTNIKGYITVYFALVQPAQFHYRALIQDFVAHRKFLGVRYVLLADFFRVKWLPFDGWSHLSKKKATPGVA